MKFFVFILVFFSTTITIASPICKVENQWKCDVYTKYDYNLDGIINRYELSDIFFDYFAPFVDKEIEGNPHFNNNFYKKLLKHIFYYHIVTGKLINPQDFNNTWSFTKFLLKETNHVNRDGMDFSDFVLALSTFRVEMS